MRRTHLASHFGIGEALSDYVRGNVLESKSIVSQFPQVEAEHLLIQVPEEVKGLHAHVGSLDAAFEKAPEVFESIGVNLPVNVFLSMVDYLVNEILVLQSLIGEQRIGIDRAVRFDVTANLGLHDVLAASGNHHCSDFATAFKNAHYRGLVFGAGGADAAIVLFLVHKAGSAADEGFVYLHLRATSAKFRGIVALHCKTDSVEHEPCGLLGDAECAGHFVGTDAVLAVGNHPHCNEPLVERESRIFHDGPDFRSELPMVVDVFALPLALILEEHGILPATSRTDYLAVRPAQLDHELEAVIGVGEVDDGLLKCLWLGAHVVPHKTNSSLAHLIFQVYYCLYKVFWQPPG